MTKNMKFKSDYFIGNEKPPFNHKKKHNLQTDISKELIKIVKRFKDWNS